MMQSLIERFRAWFTEAEAHMPVLTGLRGCAAFWVYLYHVWGHAGHPVFAVSFGGFSLDFTPLVSMGGAGVTLFFVLSGFLLSLPFAQWQAGLRERPLIGRYLLRRVLRVFPAYYLQLAVLLLIAALLSGPGALPDPASFWRHLFMLFVPPPLGTTPFNLVWWTLPIEFSFYLLLPLLAFLLRPSRWATLVVASLFGMWLWRHSVILALADAPMQLRVYSTYQLAGSLDMFGLGMLAAMIHTQRANFPTWIGQALRHDGTVVIGLALLIIAVYWLADNRSSYWADNPIFYLWTPLLSLGTVLIILAGTGGCNLAHRLFANRPVVLLGLVSYSFYLWHFPLLDGVVAGLHGLPSKASGFGYLLVISAPLILLVATVSYCVVERPGMNMRRDLPTASS